MKIRKLWSDGKSPEDIEFYSESDSDNVIYNLVEDIQCLREERNELAAQVERLRCALTELESACKACADAHGLDVYADFCESAANACHVLDETSPQSLDAVKREWKESIDSAIEGFAFTTSEGQWVVHRDDVSGLLSK